MSYTENDKKRFVRQYQIRNQQYLHRKSDKASVWIYRLTAFLGVLIVFYAIYDVCIGKQ